MKKKKQKEETEQVTMNNPEMIGQDEKEEVPEKTEKEEVQEEYEKEELPGKAEREEAPEQAEGTASKEVEELKRKSEEYFNRLLRLQADFDNYRKRVAKEREEMYNSALEGIVKQLLPVADNMERALDAFRKNGLDDEYVSGVEMIYNQFIEVLGKNGIKEIEALGREFDPNLHHAVMQVPAGDEDENIVREVFQKGYTLGQKVIRPALVKVSVRQ